MRYFKVLNVFVLLLLLAVPCFAQHKAKFHIVSFGENPHDMSPKNHEKLDPDGHPYAIIKVTSNNPDDNLGAYSFDFEHIPHIVEVKDGELWVYVGRNAMFVNISREGYHSIKRYDLGLTIQPGRAYDMSLSAESQKIMKQMVRFNISPVEAEAVVMYKSDKHGATEQLFGTADENGEIAKNLELGKYSYKIISENCYSSEGLLILGNANEIHTETVVLKPNFASVGLVASDGVSILIDGELKGTGEWKGKLKSGVYNVECSKANHKSSFETITIEEGVNVTISLSPPVPITGILSLISTPLDARITIDGKDYGATPRNINDLLIGNHKVTVSKDGYESANIDVVIKENEITEHEFTLQRSENNQTDIVSSDVNGNSGVINGHEYVDLGLPSGIKWATCNVGASKPNDYGDYYAWGETSTKSSYNEDNSTTFCKQVGNIAGNPTYDVARAKWGGNWRMPTKAEFEELLDKNNCTWKRTTQDGYKGYKVTSKINGASIFLPAAGCRYGASSIYQGTNGYYWSATPHESYSFSAYRLDFYKGYRGTFWEYRYYGRSVRPVCE